MNEKISLERSIEELDLQHEEAINELLHLKTEAVKENVALKEEIALQKESFSVKSLFQKFEHNYHPKQLKTDAKQSEVKDMFSNSLKGFNIVNIIGILWKNFDEANLNSFLKWLKEQKLLFETQVTNAGDNSNVLNRINNYVMFLQLMVEDPELFSPIIDEIATVISFLLSNHVSENSKFSVPENINEQSTNNSNSLSVTENVESETSDFCSQAFIRDFKHVKNLFSTTPKPFLCNDASQAMADTAKVSSSSLHVQTEDKNTEQNCNALVFELQQYVLQLEQEKVELQEQVSEFKRHVSELQEDLQSFMRAPSSSVLIQTENVKNEVSCFNSDKNSGTLATQTEQLDIDSNNSKLMELQVYIDILEQEKSDFQDEILKLQGLVNKSTSSTLTQTDKYVCDCNFRELEAGICILEQSNADLLEELSNVKTVLDKKIAEKTVSSIYIQTDEDSNLYDLLESKISNLQHILSLSEKDYCDTQQEMDKDLNNLREELTLKESSIQDKENIIQSLEQGLVECRTTIDSYIVKCQQMENLNNLKEELKANELCMQERENVIQSLESELKEYKIAVNNLSAKAQQAEDYNNIKNELKMKESALRDKINLILSLENELEESKCIINNLTVKLNDDLNNLKEELRVKESSIQEKEHIIRSLEKNIEEYEATVDSSALTIQQQINELNNLKEDLKSKESLIERKMCVIKSLESSLEEYKATIDVLTKKGPEAASLASAETQTLENCSCALYESEILKLRQNISERERENNDIQNQTIISVNNFKTELNSYESLMSDKDSKLNYLNLELEKYKKEINDLTDELSALRESLLNKSNENSCSCKKYESEIETLKHYLNEKEKDFVAVESNLKEILQSKDILIMDKEETIQSLKMELEEAKRSIKKHISDIKTFKAKQDYAKDIDTMEEQDLKMIMGNCNRCKSILNGEPNDNDLKNEVRVLQDKLKALDMDKNQLLCVLNEKTQECSSLKNEVHKLTNIVASEKQALFKLQQDNCLLKETRDNSDPELTKEAIQKLSGIIRDKDLEIESLKQKNVTLTALIQDVTSVPDHLQSLIEEKENLTKQINVFKADRDKIMVKYNTIDKDCRQYAAEVKKLQATLSEQKEKFDILEQKHFSVAQQYEEKQKSLINTQNEMIALKQRVSDLEQQQVDIKEKYSELLNKINSDTMIQLPKEELEEKNSQIEQLITATSEKDHLIQEKDCLIHDLSQQIKTLKLEHEQQQLNLSSLQTKIEESTSKLKDCEDLVDKLQNEKEASEMRFQDKNSELGLLKDMNERLNMSLKEKEFTMQSMTEKISSLSHYISSDHKTSDTVDINQILADSESMFSKAQSLYKERDETLLALSQSKQENQSLRNEIQRMKSNEIHLKKELERLRLHLLEIEENYTSEALKAEQREKELRDELVEVRRRAEISNTAIVDTNQRASIQIISLQEQLSMIANQRDQALAQVSTLEDKVQQHSASVSKLQLVLEQMQRGNERKIKEAEKKYMAELEKQKQLFKELEGKLQAKEMQLEESTQALEAASRLSEQLDAKEEIIANLKSELSKTESKIKSTTLEIDNIKSNTEGKVDRVVMKSLVLGYFSTPPGQKSEVIRLLARVLDFNQEEMQKAGIVVGRNAQKNEQGGLFSSIFRRLPVLGSETPPPPEVLYWTLCPWSVSEDEDYDDKL